MSAEALKLTGILLAILVVGELSFHVPVWISLRYAASKGFPAWKTQLMIVIVVATVALVYSGAFYAWYVVGRCAE